MPAVSVKGVSKRYRIFPSGQARLKEALSFGRKKYGRDFWALQDIDLEVEPGTILGILGRNGAGKSTLLNMVSGVQRPTSGTVEVNGRLVAISGYGAGFKGEFTGRENVMMNGLILGMERQEILERFDDIAALADIGEFMDQPIKTYSSGMRSRLGFAVAVNVEPEVLLLDETLAVGDAVYKETALQKVYELQDSGTTILFVSHSTAQVEDFCTEAILLHKGRKMAAGETTEIIEQYQELVSSIRAQNKKNGRTDGGQSPDHGILVPDEEGEGLEDRAFKEDSDFERRVEHLRSGTGEARIRNVEVLDEHLRPVEAVAPDSTVTVRLHLEYLEAVKESDLTITLRNKAGLKVFSASTALEKVPLKGMEKGERVIVDFAFKVPLRHDLYSVTATARAGREDLHLDRVDAATAFKITRPLDRSPFWGIVHLPTEIKVHAPEGERQGRSV
jgi:ABC-type polysaccharide/polyol phosphate transport system ATPase subunit